MDYTVLSQRVSEASSRYNDLSAKIKAAETRMAEIAVLKTHIINYSKTCEVYAAYRKAGYFKKFLAEHESEIILHRGAKKAAYADYRTARDSMKELLSIKANVDKIMGYDQHEEEKNAAHREER